MGSLDIILLVFLAALGACVGSFVNVLIYRLPTGRNVVHPPSACPGCGARIRWYDNIPVLSWVALRGRCRGCGQWISLQYPIIEALTAIAFAGWYSVAYHSGWRPHFQTLGFAHTWPAFAAYLVMFAGLIAATMIDARHYVIPLTLMWLITAVALVAMPLYAVWISLDAQAFMHAGWSDFAERASDGAAWPDTAAGTPPLTWAGHPWLGAALGGGAGLLGSVILVQARVLPRSFDASPVEQQEDEAPDAFLAHPHPRREVLKECLFLALPVMAAAGVSAVLDGRDLPSWVHALSGVLLGYLVGGGIVWATRILGTLAFGKEAMGLGDVHLMAAIGAVAGWEVAVVAFFIAPFAGLAWAVFSVGAAKVLHREVKVIPYGPHLAIASVVLIVGHRPVFELLGRLIGLQAGY